MVFSAHRGPREPQWYGGMILLLLALLAGFSGYLLPWSQQSYWASVIGTEAARAVPLIGNLLVRLIRGGDNVTGATLHRFFALHVTLLPLGFLVLLWVHLSRVWKTGLIAPPDFCASVIEEDCISCGRCERECSFGAVNMEKAGERELPRIDRHLCNACRACEKVCPPQCITFSSDRRALLTEPLFPDHFIHRTKGVLIALIVLFFSVFFLHGLILSEKVPADPLLTPDQIKPDWYFLAAYQALRWLPSKGLGLLTIVASFLLVFFLPALDRRGPRDFSRRPVYLFLVIAGIITFIIFTIRGYF
jgi:ubiquinol-cytochrome c reductase cytochrome b subunit